MSDIYLQITDKCDQQCPHCCFNCGPWNSRFIEDSVVNSGVKLAKAVGCKNITIGGGEPSLHPGVIDICSYVRRELSGSSISIISNATGDESIVKHLANFVAETPNTYLVVSNDPWHLRPSEDVMSYIEELACDRVYQRPYLPIAVRKRGRARGLPSDKTVDAGKCSEAVLTINPSGVIFPCACCLELAPRSYEDSWIHVDDVQQDSYSTNALYYCKRCVTDAHEYMYWCQTSYPLCVKELRDGTLFCHHTACFQP